MTGPAPAAVGKSQKAMREPMKVIFSTLQRRQRVCVWLTNRGEFNIEGVLSGYDEFMNLVLDDAVEVHTDNNERVSVGRIMLRGENVGLLHQV